MAKIEITNMIMVQNPENNQVLVQKRVKYWCGITFPGGHLENSESLYDSAVREVKEETGLTLLPENGTCIRSKMGDTCFSDVWLFRQDFDLKDVVLLEGETYDVMYASAEKIRQLRNEGILCSYSYLDELLECVVSNKPIKLA